MKNPKMIRENAYQKFLKKRLETEFDGVIVIKNDPTFMQGFPDLSLFFASGKAAFLEVKRSADAPLRPNQAKYIDILQKMDYFARIVYPENEEVIVHELHGYASAW